MQRGAYDEAWRVSETVLAGRDPASRDDPALPYHRRWVWDGREFRGKDVLVRCYHGFGDTLQFARYLPVLGSVARSVSVEVQPELLPLLASMPGIDRLIPFDPARPSPPAACDIEIMELAFALRLPPEAISAPYLSVPAARIAPGTIGLCWQAGGWDAGRSVPAVLMERLASRPCLALQRDPAGVGVLNPRGCPNEIVGTAALVAGLDLVITVDTMIAHLAGALGRPAWLLLKHAADWRWMKDRSVSPWYGTIRLFRQKIAGDWPGVLSEVEEALPFALRR